MTYFTLTELTRSETAKSRKIDNTPTKEAESNLVALVVNTLDPLRRLWGKPLKVNSGYRCAALNKAVGGASNSSHLYGMAADITTGSVDGNRKLWYALLASNIPYTKVINERNFSWLHISFDARNISKIKMRAEQKNGKWVYYYV